MNLFFQLAALIVLISLLVIWFMTKRLNLYSENLYYKTVYFLTVGVVLYLVITIIYSIFFETISTSLVTAITTGYMLCLVVFLYYKAMHFFSSFIKIGQCKKIEFPFAGYSLLQAIVIIAVSNKYEYLESGIHLTSIGSYLLIAYFTIHFVLVGTSIILNQKRINWHFKKLYIIDCAILLVGILLECVLKINGSLNLVLAFDCAYVMCFIENSKGNIDTTFGCFKQNVLLPFLEEKYDERKKYFVVVVGFGYLTTNETIENDVKEFKKEIIDEFLTVLDTSVFINADGSIFALCDRDIYEDFVEDTKEIIYDKINDYPSLKSIKIGITSCANILLTDNEFILINHLSSCLKNIFSGVKQIDYKEVTRDIIDSILREEEINDKIVWALENDKLEVFYQPIFSNEKNSFTSAEALARIRNEDGTVVLPGIFIPIAEKNGLIIQIGDRVYEKVCEFLSAPGTNEYDLEFVSINLSNIQCEEQGLASRYIQLAKKYNINPKKIEFEINELDAISIKDKVKKNMEEFANNGFRVALDGYGNKESTFYSLLDFPVTSLKLDMHLIWNYSESAIQREVSQAIIRMAHDLNIEIVAEGVETLTQLEDMVKQEVDYIQGYYFFVPMDLSSYRQFLRPTAFEVNEENVTAMDKINSIRYSSKKAS